MWQEAKNSDVFSEAEHWHKNPVSSLSYAGVSKSIIYITTHKQEAPIYQLSHSKAPKTQQNVGYKHMSKPVYFYNGIK